MSYDARGAAQSRGSFSVGVLRDKEIPGDRGIIMEFEMQRLKPDMMARYEIDDHRPARINAIEFGMGEAMLATVNRLIDGKGLGVVCVEAENPGYARRLRKQGGLYTVVIRGYQGETPVRREQVVQCVLDAREAGDMDGLAENPDITLGIVDDTGAARALAARFVALRRAAGQPVPPLMVLGSPVEGAKCFRLLADSLAFRSEPDEAARLCAEMNYLDDMLHIAEPYARLTLEAGARACFPDAEGICFEHFEEALRLKQQVFDAGLFLMAAAGWLNGCDTLRDCMTHPRLRGFIGEGFTEEILPALSDMDRAAVERQVIESFERYENPLNRNRLLRAAERLPDIFVRGPLALLRRLNEETFEPPRRLAFALAATIMLYAGARPNPDTGVYEVARGKTAEALHDDPERLALFATLAHDMPPESLAYAALADRELWGMDLREIDGLEARVALDIAAMQREPSCLP